MSGVKAVARIIAAAALTAAAGVAGNQVLNNGKLSWAWAYVALAVAVLAALYAEVFSPAPSIGTRATRSVGAMRGRRRVYLRQLRASVDDLETTGIATQGEFVLGLRQVYVDVSLAHQPPQDTASEPYVGQARRTPGERRTLASFIDAGGANRVFAVIGGPGSGKTTLMRSTALQLCQFRLRRWRLPILVYLRDHAPSIVAVCTAPGLAAVAAEAGWVAGTTPASWLERRLDRGGCLVMLDGLDEVAKETDRSTMVAWVRRQIERHPRNTYLLTSRPHGYLSNPLPNAEVLQVRRFTGEQISQFLHQWYNAVETRAHGATAKHTIRIKAARKADDLLGRLRTRPGLYDLAANPLLLTMIANVHRYRDALPGSRAALYAEMCDVLMHRRQESKGLIDSTGLRGAQKAHIVRGLALTMMRAKIRDIAFADACQAIAEDLQDTASQITPADFLDEVRKSGLLVEREHGRYAFAHLTLQEYLAASHLGHDDAVLLADNVDDPWWRETTLLWAATADATSIITACRTSGTPRALALAFDCAEEARAISFRARRQLNRMLDPDTDTADVEYRRLVTTVRAARTLREVIWFNDDTVICAKPVTNGLYRLFALDEQTAGRHTPAPGDDGPNPDTDEDAPAIGMWADDAARFITWLNDLFDDGTTYRPPTPEELTDPAFGLVTDLTRHTVWADTTPRPTLYRPEGAPWPYTLAPDQLHQIVIADRQTTRQCLRLALTEPADRDRVLAHTRVFTAALTPAPGLDRLPGLSLRRLVLNLALARALCQIRTSSRGLDPDRDPDRALDCALDCALDVTRARSSDRDVALDRDLALDLDRDLDRDFARADVPGFDLDRAQARGLDVFRARARARARALDLCLDRALALNRALEIDVDLDVARALESGLDHVNDGAIAGAIDAALRRALDLGRTFDIDLDLPFTDGFDGALDSAMELVMELADRDLPRDFTADTAWSQTATDAFRQLLKLWTPQRSKHVKTGEALTDFDAFLISTLSEAPRTPEPPPEDPLGGYSLAVSPQNSLSDPENTPRDQARLLINQAHVLIGPILDRTAPADGFVMASARIALLTAAALFRKDGDEDAAARTLQTLRSLIAIHQRINGHLVPNEILLLVRT